MKTLSAWRVAVAFFAGAGAVCAAESNAVPVWADTAPLTAQNVVLALEDGTFVRVDVLGERLFRIRHARTPQWRESALNRYGILTQAFPAAAFRPRCSRFPPAFSRLRHPVAGPPAPGEGLRQNQAISKAC